MNITGLRIFITSGHAIFTVKSLKSGSHMTFKVDDVKGSDDTRYFVSVLTGPDNTRDYTYAGLMFLNKVTGDLSFGVTKKSGFTQTSPQVRAFRWLVASMNREVSVEGKAEIDHVGKCGRCGRALTHPESLKTGLGPECATKV